MENAVFEIELMVRDYECDMQGIVNNAVYQNYLEHARHEFLHSIGLSFEQLCKDGIDAVVTRVEIDYRQSLKSRDLFSVCVGVHKQGRLRFVFDQCIIRQSDGVVVVEAQVTGVLTRNGRPIAPVVFDEIFQAKGWTI